MRNGACRLLEEKVGEDKGRLLEESAERVSRFCTSHLQRTNSDSRPEEKGTERKLGVPHLRRRPCLEALDQRAAVEPGRHDEGEDDGDDSGEVEGAREGGVERRQQDGRQRAAEPRADAPAARHRHGVPALAQQHGERVVGEEDCVEREDGEGVHCGEELDEQRDGLGRVGAPVEVARGLRRRAEEVGRRERQSEVPALWLRVVERRRRGAAGGARASTAVVVLFACAELTVEGRAQERLRCRLLDEAVQGCCVLVRWVVKLAWRGGGGRPVTLTLS